MTPEELARVVAAHRAWLRDEPGGVRADLSCVTLIGADLRADLRRAILHCADLRGANLRGANLQEADLSVANLVDAHLDGADLTFASLRDASLVDADLSMATLREADLRGANLSDARLDGANLGARSIVPEEGAFRAWTPVDGGVLLVEVPDGAARVSSLVCRRCRAASVLVLRAYDLSGNASDLPEYKCAHRLCRDTYKLGQVAITRRFDPDIRDEYEEGIPIFLTRAEAEEEAAEVRRIGAVPTKD